MVNLNRQIAVARARAGGFSSHVLPGVVGYQPASSFVFEPQQVDDQWQLTDGTPLSVWHANELNQIEPEFAASGAPGGGAIIRYKPYMWGGLQPSQDVKFVTTDGMTLDGWVRFPGAGVDADSTLEKATTIGWGLSRVELGTEASGGSYAPTVNWPSSYIEVGYSPVGPLVGGQRNKRLYVRLLHRQEGAVKGRVVIVLQSHEGATSAQVGGWHHYALELSPAGVSTLYFDGNPVSTVDDEFAPAFAEMDRFFPAWVFFQQSEGIIYDVETSKIRYRKRLVYGGQSFAP